MTTLSQTKELFRRAEAVCFDVDSTVIKEEGIDELAKFCGVGDAVTEMCVTRKYAPKKYISNADNALRLLFFCHIQDSEGHGGLHDV